MPAFTIANRLVRICSELRLPPARVGEATGPDLPFAPWTGAAAQLRRTGPSLRTQYSVCVEL